MRTIPLNVAASSSFALMIGERIKFAEQNPLQSYKVPHRLKLPGGVEATMHESTEKLVAPVLAVAKKYGATIAFCCFSKTVKWWQQLATPTSSRCLLGK